MKAMVCNTVTGNFLAETLVYNAINDAAPTGEYTVDLTDCKGEVDLLVDASASTAAVTMTICGGDYVGKMADTTYTLAAGDCKRISISSAETMKTDGTLHIKWTATANLSTLGVRAAVLKRRYVTNH